MPIHSVLLLTIKLLSKFVLHCGSVPEVVENEVFLLSPFSFFKICKDKKQCVLRTLSRVGILLFVSSQYQVLPG